MTKQVLFRYCLTHNIPYIIRDYEEAGIKAIDINNNIFPFINDTLYIAKDYKEAGVKTIEINNNILPFITDKQKFKEFLLKKFSETSLTDDVSKKTVEYVFSIKLFNE